MEYSTEVTQKFQNRITMQCSSFTPGYLSKENKNTNSKRDMYPYAHCSIIYNSQDMGYILDIMEYYSAIKKNWILTFTTTWMHLENIMLGKISQTEKDKYCMISLMRGIWKTNEET